ncbi:hypothetical protein KNJ79_02250 [Sphingopyxis indica]|uniref:hypothetical protein n=1 Tax=Sphingopyxis indica TaxID=436663 RepID=UPI002938DB69|nr:hypothetical protein [Sphingopyxis indica]WOF43807.1 hypothetical protein KNJ79_02250 [Sphingopyxis indica]
MSAARAEHLPYWPRLMNRPLAAAYLGIGETKLTIEGPAPKRLGKRVLYDIRDLDRWADALDGQPLDDAQRKDEGDDIERRVRERLMNGKG